MLLNVKIHAQRTVDTGHFTNVYLDGKNVTSDCVEADDVEGRVVLMVRDAAGHPLPDPEAPGPLYRTQYGRVQYTTTPATVDQMKAAQTTADHYAKRDAARKAQG